MRKFKEAPLGNRRAAAQACCQADTNKRKSHNFLLEHKTIVKEDPYLNTLVLRTHDRSVLYERTAIQTTDTLRTSVSLTKRYGKLSGVGATLTRIRTQDASAVSALTTAGWTSTHYERKLTIYRFVIVDMAVR